MDSLIYLKNRRPATSNRFKNPDLYEHMKQLRKKEYQPKHTTKNYIS